jgi:hypothetical protein
MNSRVRFVRAHRLWCPLRLLPSRPLDKPCFTCHAGVKSGMAIPSEPKKLQRILEPGVQNSGIQTSSTHAIREPISRQFALIHPWRICSTDLAYRVTLQRVNP